MKLSEKFNIDESTDLFTRMNTIKPFPWIEYFSPNAMYITWVTLYGNRQVNPSFEDVNEEFLANMLIGLYSQKWSLWFNRMTAIIPAGDSTTTTRQEQGTASITENKENVVSAFDSENYEEKDKDITTGSNSDTRSITETKTRTRDTTIIYTERYLNILTSSQIYDIIFSDINKVLTIAIFKED